MNIIERYVSGYVVECMTGTKGSEHRFAQVLSATKAKVKHPFLKSVLDLVREDGDSDDTRATVRKMAMSVKPYKYAGYAYRLMHDGFLFGWRVLVYEQSEHSMQKVADYGFNIEGLGMGIENMDKHFPDMERIHTKMNIEL